MKLTRHNGRSGKHGTYNPRHNDRRFDVENSEHIDAQRAKKNVYWDCYRGITTPELREKPEQPDFSFEEIERMYYYEHYSDQMCIRDSIQDEWANVAQPESYPKILATCRSYNIGLNIIVQNVQQIKALYEKEHESIIGNCDTLLFLGGGNEPASLEFIVKLLGRETLATRTRGLTKGRNGSSTTNYQQTGRDMPYLSLIHI